MRFFEFKLPDADSDFAKQLESYLEKLIASARQLPETDPRRQKFDASLTQLQAQAGVTEDAVEDANAKVVQSVVGGGVSIRICGRFNRHK